MSSCAMATACSSAGARVPCRQHCTLCRLPSRWYYCCTSNASPGCCHATLLILLVLLAAAGSDNLQTTRCIQVLCDCLYERHVMCAFALGAACCVAGNRGCRTSAEQTGHAQAIARAVTAYKHITWVCDLVMQTAPENGALCATLEAQWFDQCHCGCPGSATQ